MQNIESWVDKEFNNVYIADQRNVNRLKLTANLLAQNPTAAIPQACTESADIKGAYRLLENGNITHDGILAGHRNETVKRAGKHKTILALQDTTHLDFSTHPATQDLGLYSDSPTLKGLLVHTSMAVTTEGLPLGILSQRVWTRDPKEYGKKHKRKSLPIEQKESNKWLTSLEDSIIGIPDGTRIITVCDREADIYEFFQKAVSQGKDFVVRARDNRRISGECEKLIPKIESQPVSEVVILEIPRKPYDNIKQRKATVEIRYCSVNIKPPVNLKAASKLPEIQLYAVLLSEINAPQKVSPIYWLLLTTLEVKTPEEALITAGYYKQRWKVERFHYTLKSGCNIESRQQETKSGLEKELAIYSVIAWHIMYTKYLAETAPNTSCEATFEKNEWQLLYCVVNKTRALPSHIPTIKEAILMLAKLGGFMGRKCDGQPGLKVLWRGLSRLYTMLEAVNIFNPNFSNDMGKV